MLDSCTTKCEPTSVFGEGRARVMGEAEAEDSVQIAQRFAKGAKLNVEALFQNALSIMSGSRIKNNGEYEQTV